MEKLFNNYEAKLSGQMVKSLGCSIINMYSVGACSVLGITNQDALSEDLKGELQRQNKLISSERPFKILQNETKIIKIGHAVLEIFNFKD